MWIRRRGNNRGRQRSICRLYVEADYLDIDFIQITTLDRSVDIGTRRTLRGGWRETEQDFRGCAVECFRLCT
jgi:hypothetical protein